MFHLSTLFQEVKYLQETGTSPVAIDTACRFTMTWMTENLQQHKVTWQLLVQWLHQYRQYIHKHLLLTSITYIYLPLSKLG